MGEYLFLFRFFELFFFFFFFFTGEGLYDGDLGNSDNTLLTGRMELRARGVCPAGVCLGTQEFNTLAFHPRDLHSIIPCLGDKRQLIPSLAGVVPIRKDPCICPGCRGGQRTRRRGSRRFGLCCVRIRELCQTCCSRVPFGHGCPHPILA